MSRHKLISVIHPIKMGYVVEPEKEFMNNTYSYVIKMNSSETSDYVTALEDTRIALRSLLKKAVDKTSVKFNLRFDALMTKPETSQMEEARFHSHVNKLFVLLTANSIDKAITKIFQSIYQLIEDYNKKSSGWVFYAPIRLNITITKYLSSMWWGIQRFS